MWLEGVRGPRWIRSSSRLTQTRRVHAHTSSLPASSPGAGNRTGEGGERGPSVRCRRKPMPAGRGPSSQAKRQPPATGDGALTHPSVSGRTEEASMKRTGRSTVCVCVGLGSRPERAAPAEEARSSPRASPQCGSAPPLDLAQGPAHSGHSRVSVTCASDAGGAVNRAVTHGVGGEPPE